MTLAKDPKSKEDEENKHPKFNHKNSTLVQTRTQNKK